MSHEPEKVNPFADEAAAHAMAEALRQMEWELELKRREAHVEACLAIMKFGVMPRVELAAAMKDWGNTAEVTGVARTETFSGMTHLRIKMMINGGTIEGGRLEFIASPISMVIAAEGERGHEKRRWQKISLTSENISGQCDHVISEFITWGCVKR